MQQRSQQQQSRNQSLSQPPPAPDQQQVPTDNKPNVSISKYGIIIEETKKPEPVAKPILKKESVIGSQQRRSVANDENAALAQSVMNIANLLQSQMNMNPLGRQSFMGMPMANPFQGQFNQFDMNTMNQQQMLPLQLLFGQQPPITQQITEKKSIDNLLATMGLGGNTSDTQDEEDVSQGGRVYKGTRKGGKLKVADKPKVATYLREEKEH